MYFVVYKRICSTFARACNDNRRGGFGNFLPQIPSRNFPEECDNAAGKFIGTIQARLHRRRKINAGALSVLESVKITA